MHISSAKAAVPFNIKSSLPPCINNSQPQNFIAMRTLITFCAGFTCFFVFLRSIVFICYFISTDWNIEPSWCTSFMLHSKYLILPNQFVNSCNSWKFEGFSCHLSFLYKGGYKQILGIEGNSSIATDMSVWDGVSAITRVLLKMVKVSENWSI